MTLNIVILAAGQGKRMHSQTPKVLHRLAGKPLLEHVIDTARKLDPDTKPIIIHGHKGEMLRHALADANVTWVEQAEQLGTGHAVQQALPHLDPDSRVLILYGDVPLTTVETLNHFIKSTPAKALGIITAALPDPTGFGRIIRDNDDEIVRIVEEKDATDEQRAIDEVNSGIYLASAHHLQKWLPSLQNNNAQQEYYLTDIIRLAVKNKTPIHSIQPKEYEEILGINDRLQLASLECYYQQNQAEKLMLQGVTIIDPHRFDVRGEVSIGQDVTIDINVILEGHVKIGHGTLIGPNTIIRNSIIGERVEIKANSVIDGAEVANECIIGPFARLRPGTELAEKAHVGNFVEIKKSFIDVGTKINHLSYIGDSEIGKHVNIGAGTITCNYDGVNKHKTIIGDNAFIGSNTELVAPVSIGEGATIGAGSTITHNAPAGQLTLRRAEQRTIMNWQRPKKKTEEV